MNPIALKFSLLAFIIMLFGTDVMAGKKKVSITCSETDAQIFMNGNLVGRGNAKIIIPAYTDAQIRVEKVGFLTEETTFFNTPGNPAPPKSYHFKLVVDDAYEASVQTDIANLDLEIKTSKPLDDAWQLLNSIVLQYIDVIEVTDKETGYLRTAWQVQNFKRATIRTRVIIKLGGKNPLSYKLKLVSEYAPKSMVSPKEDQSFKEWDRVLRKYEGIVSELPARMQ